MRTFCHNCPTAKADHDTRSKVCPKCPKVRHDDIRIQHSPHPRTDRLADASQHLRESSPAFRNISEDAADTFRRALYDFFDLEPIQLLLVQHLMKQRKLTSFGDVLADLANKIMRYRGSEKAKACAMSKAIRAKLPVLEPIIHEKAQEFEHMDDAAPLGDLFENAGIPLESATFERKTPQ